MKETDIRPSELIKGQEKAFQHDMDRLLKYKRQFVRVQCPACDCEDGVRDSLYKFEKQGFYFKLCRVCGTTYLNPRPVPALLADYYQNSEHYKYWSKFIFP